MNGNNLSSMLEVEELLKSRLEAGEELSNQPGHLIASLTSSLGELAREVLHQVPGSELKMRLTNLASLALQAGASLLSQLSLAEAPLEIASGEGSYDLTDPNLDLNQMVLVLLAKLGEAGECVDAALNAVEPEVGESLMESAAEILTQLAGLCIEFSSQL